MLCSIHLFIPKNYNKHGRISRSAGTHVARLRYHVIVNFSAFVGILSRDSEGFWEYITGDVECLKTIVIDHRSAVII